MRNKTRFIFPIITIIFSLIFSTGFVYSAQSDQTEREIQLPPNANDNANKNSSPPEEDLNTTPEPSPNPQSDSKQSRSSEGNPAESEKPQTNEETSSETKKDLSEPSQKDSSKTNPSDDLKNVNDIQNQGEEVRHEDNQSKEIRIINKQEIEIIDKDSQEVTKIATGSANTITIKRGLSQAYTTLPLVIDSNTHELSITTLSGTKPLTVLPDQAAANLLRTKELSLISDNSQAIEIALIDDAPVYKVTGEKVERLLGLFKVVIKKEVHVSADTGKVVKTKKNTANTILDFLSF